MTTLSKKSKKPKLSEHKRLGQLVAKEISIRNKGYQKIAGVDEAGRGPLAGPVVAAACIIDETLLLEGINDSKQLAEKKREILFKKLISHEKVTFGIGVIGPHMIDQINILKATILAMHEAINHLSDRPDYVLVDGGINLDGIDIPSEGVIKGDSSCYVIAAASIIAKCTRDELMKKWHCKYPNYGFDKHKGYGTKSHMQAINKYGPCPIHRRSFEPIKQVAEHAY